MSNDTSELPNTPYVGKYKTLRINYLDTKRRRTQNTSINAQWKSQG